MAVPSSKPSSTRPVFDVTDPNKTPVTPNSVPIIPNKQPLQRDPMTVVAEPSAMRTLHKLRIEPLPQDTDAIDEEKNTETESTEITPRITDKVTGSVESFDDDTSKELKDPTAAQDQANLKQAEHDAEIEKLVASHQYYLPINQLQRQRTKQLIWLTLAAVIVIGLAWTYLLLDASILTIPGIAVPTHFFK